MKRAPFRDDIRDALGTLIERYTLRVREARAAERAMIDAKTTLPNNYWVPRMKAEQHLKAAVAMLDAVLES
jgi:hypothetical protein